MAAPDRLLPTLRRVIRCDGSFGREDAMRSVLGAVVVLGLVGVALPAAAGTVKITYQIQPGVGSLGCCPPTGSLTPVGGQFTWRLPAAGPQTLLSGTATLLAFSAVAATPSDVGIKLVSPFVHPNYFFASLEAIYHYGTRVAAPVLGGRSFTQGPFTYSGYWEAQGLGGPTATMGLEFCCYLTPSFQFVDLFSHVQGIEVSRTFSLPEPAPALLVALSTAGVGAYLGARAWRHRAFRASR
jgi:hypothetical protein